MSKDLISYGEWWPEHWDPRQAARTFDGMIIAGTIGTVVGIAGDNRPVISASVASFGAGIFGRVILALLGYDE